MVAAGRSGRADSGIQRVGQDIKPHGDLNGRVRRGRCQETPGNRTRVAVNREGQDEREAAEYLGIPLGLIQAAVAYYGAYRDEIDEWIELNARESKAAHEAWLAGQQALKR